MARLQRLLRRQSSASDSILRCLERKWPACSVCCDDDLPRPTPFFVAAKKVVPPAASVATIIFHVRFNSSMRQRKMVPPADRSNTELQRFLISWGKLGNRCRECPGLALLRAVIHDFRGSIWESLQENPLEQRYRCSDSRFQAQTWESLQVFPKKQPKGCSDS